MGGKVTSLPPSPTQHAGAGVVSAEPQRSTGLARWAWSAPTSSGSPVAAGADNSALRRTASVSTASTTTPSGSASNTPGSTSSSSSSSAFTGNSGTERRLTQARQRATHSMDALHFQLRRGLDGGPQSPQCAINPPGSAVEILPSTPAGDIVMGEVVSYDGRTNTVVVRLADGTTRTAAASRVRRASIRAPPGQPSHPHPAVLSSRLESGRLSRELDARLHHDASGQPQASHRDASRELHGRLHHDTNGQRPPGPRSGNRLRSPQASWRADGGGRRDVLM